MLAFGKLSSLSNVNVRLVPFGSYLLTVLGLLLMPISSMYTNNSIHSIMSLHKSIIIQFLCCCKIVFTRITSLFLI